MTSPSLSRKRNFHTVSCQKLFPVKLLEFLNLEKHNDVIGWVPLHAIADAQYIASRARFSERSKR